MPSPENGHEAASLLKQEYQCRAIWESLVTNNAFPMNEWCEGGNLRLDLTLGFKVKVPLSLKE